jgi:hypothetical protein
VPANWMIISSSPPPLAKRITLNLESYEQTPRLAKFGNLATLATMIEITDSAVSVFQQILLSGIDPYDLESDEGRMT